MSEHEWEFLGSCEEVVGAAYVWALAYGVMTRRQAEAREEIDGFACAYARMARDFAGVSYRSCRSGREFFYNRVVDDDGPSARGLYPWPFLADGQSNPAYLVEVDAKEAGCSVAMLELMRRSELVSYRSARTE